MAYELILPSVITVEKFAKQDFSLFQISFYIIRTGDDRPIKQNIQVKAYFVQMKCNQGI